MIEVSLNPPRKSRKKSKPRSKKKKSGRRKKASRVCIPKRALRKAKRLKTLKRKAKPRKKDLICMPKSTLTKARSLKKLKRKHLGTKYGYAKTPRKRGFLEDLLSAPKPKPKPKPRAKPRKAKKRKAKAKGKRFSYLQVLSMTPYERRQAGITAAKEREAGRKQFVYATPKAKPKPKASRWPKGDIAANPRKHRFNYVVPTYAFNDAATLDGFRDSLTAGFRPGILAQAVPVAGGLLGNSIIAGMATKAISKRWAIDPKWKGPMGLAIGLGSAGVLALGTNMLKPRYAKHVLLGGVAQVVMDAYQTYVKPNVESALNIPGMLGSPDLTFGLHCPECNPLGNMGDSLTPEQVETAKPVVADAVGMVMPNAAIAAQVPSNPSAPATASVNGQEVEVERIQGGVGDFGDYLTPNQVTQASPLGDISELLS